MRTATRALIVDDGHLLVARGEGAHLPGGGLIPGEEPVAALRREFVEELGVELVDVEPLGTFPFPGVGERTLLFRASAPALDSAEAPSSNDPRLRFTWVALDALDELELWPPGIASKIARHIAAESRTRGLASTHS